MSPARVTQKQPRIYQYYAQSRPPQADIHFRVHPAEHPKTSKALILRLMLGMAMRRMMSETVGMLFEENEE